MPHVALPTRVGSVLRTKTTERETGEKDRGRTGERKGKREREREREKERDRGGERKGEMNGKKAQRVERKRD